MVLTGRALCVGLVRSVDISSEAHASVRRVGGGRQTIEANGRRWSFPLLADATLLGSKNGNSNSTTFSRKSGCEYTTRHTYRAAWTQIQHTFEAPACRRRRMNPRPSRGAKIRVIPQATAPLVPEYMKLKSF